ncbi:restriction endonuclease subunit S [Mycoplasma sp. 480]|uniref:restriction endonuclease subunit S n=1 Tax=Mycoplasma sp. 480 TaxID=3440155 RepID=UPI003F518609
MISKDKLVPSLRFKEFTHAWEQDVIQNLFNITRGYVLSTKKISESKTGIKKFPVYSSQTLNNGLLGYYDKFLYKDAITWTTDGANAGTVNFREGKFYCTNVCGVLLEKTYKPNLFLANALARESFKFVMKAGNPKLMNNIVAEIKINITKQINEQEKISKLFTSIDSLLSLHKRKYNFLKNIKNTLLDNMFPSQNSNIPSIRFKEFTHAWEQDNLGNLVSIQNGKLNANSMENNGKYNFYTSGKEIFKINSWSFEGDAVTIAGNGASMGFIHRAKGKFDAYQRTYVLKTEKLNIDFLYFNLWNNLWNDVQKKISNGGIPFIVYDDINLFPFKTPSYNEQTKIANLFTHLDSLLSLHKRKLTALENIKAKLLERMFI